MLFDKDTFSWTIFGIFIQSNVIVTVKCYLHIRFIFGQFFQLLTVFIPFTCILVESDIPELIGLLNSYHLLKFKKDLIRNISRCESGCKRLSFILFESWIS